MPVVRFSNLYSAIEVAEHALETAYKSAKEAPHEEVRDELETMICKLACLKYKEVRPALERARRENEHHQ